ncbi:MAG: restriction endonuclease subunit S [Coleofasciculus sp.]|uniref:restriction endonuclease subunit S n=1 Tax=Coleofasciculus sp. TaxID=3100458 RepID=UPI003A367248
MGQYQGYEKYKDSGVEWLGEIPESWKVQRVKFIGDIKYGLGEPPEQLEDGLPIIRATDIYRGIIDGSKVQRVNPDKVPWSRDPELKTGDILVVRSGAYTGDSAIIPDEWAGSIAGYDMVLTPTKAHPKYVAWNLLGRHVLEGQLYLAKSRAAQPHLNAEELGNTILAIPPLEEQNTIAQFLDYKTSQIDALIAKKEALLEKLDEKRTALISHAVTKGLDPTVPMKDSGIEWLGDIPAHWEVKKLRYVGSCQNGVSKGGDYFGSGYPFVNYTDVYANPELPKEVNGLAQSTEEDRINYSVKAGDIFFTRTSETIEEIGITSTCLQSIKNAIFSGFLIRVRPFDNSLFPAFSKYYFRSQRHRLFFVKEMNLVTRASLSQDLLKRLPVLLPPFEEQKAIAQNLARRTGEIDQQKAKIQQAIDLLKEYRTALITNAVTGKIDIRQVPIPQP